MNTITHHISVYYQSEVSNESGHIGKTFQVHNVTKEEAIEKVIKYIYENDYEKHKEEDETFEDYRNYFTVIPEGETSYIEFNDEEGYVLQISTLITL